MNAPPSTPRFALRTLGAFELRAINADGSDGARVLGPGKPLALLAFCCSAREREYSRDALAALLWSDADPTRARQSLRQALWRVRRATADALVVRDDAVLGVTDAVSTDREAFLGALHSGDVRAAIDVYGGAFLAGVSLPGGDEFDDWASLERRHLEGQLVRSAEPYFQGLLRAGKPARVRLLAERMLRVAPDSSEAHRIAIECFLAGGDRAAARRTADELEAQLRNNDERLSPATAALIARTHDDDPDLSPGESRITPVALDLVGREDAFSTALDAWAHTRRGESRTVVLSGVAGIGKSRLLGAIAERCTSKRSLSISVRANVGERDLPFGFAATIARALATLPGAAGVGAESAREIVALDPGLGTVFHAAPSYVAGGEAVRRRALAVLDLLTAIAEQEPVALFLDDLHWADSASRQLLSIVLQRTSNLPVFVVGTTRGTIAGLFDDRTTTVVLLPPLARPDVIDAIRSSGAWPDSTDASRFITALADSCEGIPLQVIERLGLVEERGLLSRTDVGWTSPDWSAATQVVAVASPAEQRVLDCMPDERTLLTLLALAGAPLPESVLSAAMDTEWRGTTAAVHDALLSLEVKGLARFEAERWQPSHDLVGEATLALVAPAERTDTHRRVGHALAGAANGDMLASAMRHLLLAGEDTHAGEVLARLVNRARSAGDRRPPPELFFALTGETLPTHRLRRVLRPIRWWHRVKLPHPAVTMATSLMFVALVLLTAWRTTRKPALMFAQAPLTVAPVPAVGMEGLRFVPPAIITGADSEAFARVGAVRVRSLSTGVELFPTDSAQQRDGRASFGGLRIRTHERVARLRFEADGFAPLDLTMDVSNDNVGVSNSLRQSMRLLGGRINGQGLAANAPAVRVRPGTMLSGVVQVEYDAPWPSASVWLSMTPTWGKPQEVARELWPVTTPVRQEVIDVPVNLQVPDTKGSWWIILLINAEPSGFYALSNTNWLVEKAVWGDGNDVAAFPDSLIRVGIARGWVESRHAYPGDRPVSQVCDRDTQRVNGILLRYCRSEMSLTGIQVIVE